MITLIQFVNEYNVEFLDSYQGHISAALVLGGVDVTGPHLHTVSTKLSAVL